MIDNVTVCYSSIHGTPHSTRSLDVWFVFDVLTSRALNSLLVQPASQPKVSLFEGNLAGGALLNLA